MVVVEVGLAGSCRCTANAHHQWWAVATSTRTRAAAWPAAGRPPSDACMTWPQSLHMPMAQLDSRVNATVRSAPMLCIVQLGMRCSGHLPHPCCCTLPHSRQQEEHGCLSVQVALHLRQVKHTWSCEGAGHTAPQAHGALLFESAGSSAPQADCIQHDVQVMHAHPSSRRASSTCSGICLWFGPVVPTGAWAWHWPGLGARVWHAATRVATWWHLGMHLHAHIAALGAAVTSTQLQAGGAACLAQLQMHLVPAPLLVNAGICRMPGPTVACHAHGYTWA